MNKVSILIYLADVLQNLDYVALFGLVVAVFFTIAGIVMYANQEPPASGSPKYATIEAYNHAMAEHKRRPGLYDHPGVNPATYDPTQTPEDTRKPLSSFLKKPLAGMAVAASIIVVTPSAITVYAIAASETAEQVLQSPSVNKAVNALNRWLDKQAK